MNVLVQDIQKATQTDITTRTDTTTRIKHPGGLTGGNQQSKKKHLDSAHVVFSLQVMGLGK